MSLEEPKKPASPRLRRLLGFISFRVFPLLLIIGIIWSGILVFSAFLERMGETNQVAGRVPAYIQTATAIAPENGEQTESRAQDMVVADRSDAAYQNAQLFATNTPHPDSVTPTATPIPVQPTQFMLPTLLAPAEPEADRVDITAIPTKFPVIQRDYDLVNIMLLGSDATTDNFIRTDTMIIVSINVETGSVAMISLPRDLLVYIPTGQRRMQRLNVAYGIGEAIGWTDGGFGLLRQVIFYNLGINVHYFARVDFDGFSQVIDTLGGIDLAVDCNYEDYAIIGAEVPSAAYLSNEETAAWTLPIGYFHFTGPEALWYARTRGVSDDFDRGRRQQKVLRAIYRKGRQMVDLSNFQTLWEQASSAIETDLSFQDVLGLLPIALNMGMNQIENYTLIRTYHTIPWQTPDGDYVQLPNPEPVRELLTEFYQPPTSSQLALARPSIAIYNGTSNENWDIVAADRLDWEGFNAISNGAASTTDFTDTIIIDRTGDTKNSLATIIARILGVPNSNIRAEPDPNRQHDYEVIVGNSYNSCTYGVLQNR